MLFWSLCVMLFLGLVFGSLNSFDTIDSDEDLTGSDSDFQGSSDEPVFDLNLTRTVRSAWNPFEFKDVDLIMGNFVKVKQFIAVDTSDMFLMTRIIHSDLAVVECARTFAVYENFSHDQVTSGFPFRSESSHAQPIEVIDYEVLYADPVQELAGPVDFAASTPPPSPEQIGKRKRLPECPMNTGNAVKRRCRAALDALSRNTPDIAAELTQLQVQFNKVMRSLSLAQFSSKEFRELEAGDGQELLKLVQRCPEEYLVPCMLYSLMGDGYLHMFSRLYEQEYKYWQRRSRAFAFNLLTGILLLPEASFAALNYFQTQKNPYFFLNHETDFNFLIGCFHYEDVIEARAHVANLGHAGNNCIANWLKQESVVIYFSSASDPQSFIGFLPLLHRSRILFQSDEEHLDYINAFFYNGVSALSRYSPQLNYFLSVFLQSKMLLKLLNWALINRDREFIMTALQLYQLENNPIKIRIDSHEILNVSAGDEFLVEDHNLSTFRIMLYRII